MSLLHILCPTLVFLASPFTAQGQGCQPGRYPDDTQCDAYLECGSDGTVTRQQCLDGLVFSPERRDCVYPQETNCDNRPALQPANPSLDCPRQFGLYRLGDANNCGQYTSCAHGKAFVMDCPEGLAFNEYIARCDWPDLVPTCNAEGYLGFSCPFDGSTSVPGQAGVLSYYPSGYTCDRFFVCVNGRPRLLKCGKDEAFDYELSTCVPKENVQGC